MGVDGKANVATFIKGACTLKADTIQLDLYLQQSAAAEGVLLSGCRKDQTQPAVSGISIWLQNQRRMEKKFSSKKKTKQENPHMRHQQGFEFKSFYINHLSLNKEFLNA